jgi:hypothetical protein
MTRKQKDELLDGAIKANVVGQIKDFDRHVESTGKEDSNGS